MSEANGAAAAEDASVHDEPSDGHEELEAEALRAIAAAETKVARAEEHLAGAQEALAQATADAENLTRKDA